MKKVLFLFAFLLLGIGAMAQKVIYDETNQTGVRTVVCEGTVELRITLEAFGTEHKHQIMKALEDEGLSPREVNAKLY